MFIERAIKEQFVKYLDKDQILILVGARQTGKTTFLKSLYRELDPARNTFFVNLENPALLSILNEHPDNIFKVTNSSSSVSQIVFIDEIQYLDDPTNFMKYLYDEYKGTVKLIVSGSSSFYIDKKFKDSLLGRKKVFHLYGLDFKEFLRFKGQESVITDYGSTRRISPLNKTMVDQLIAEYLTFGSYPAVVLEEDYDLKKELIAEIAIDYIKKDIYEANINEQDKYFNLLKILARQVGGLINSNELATILRLSASTVEKYLYIMQKSFQLAIIKPFFKNFRKELTKMPKAFFFDLGLRNYLVNNFEYIEYRDDKGSCLENTVFRELALRNQIDRIKFWRTQNKNEVDFVVDEKSAYEVKFSAPVKKVSKYSAFIEAYPEIDFSFLEFSDLPGLLLS